MSYSLISRNEFLPVAILVASTFLYSRVAAQAIPRPSHDDLSSSLKKRIIISAQISSKVGPAQTEKALAFAHQCVEKFVRDLPGDSVPNGASDAQLKRAMAFGISVEATDERYIQALVAMQVRSVRTRIAYAMRFPEMSEAEKKRLQEQSTEYYAKVRERTKQSFTDNGFEAGVPFFESRIGEVEKSTEKGIGANEGSARYTAVPSEEAWTTALDKYTDELKKRVQKDQIETMKDGDRQRLIASLALSSKKRLVEISTSDDRKSFNPEKEDPEYHRLVKEYTAISTEVLKALEQKPS